MPEKTNTELNKPPSFFVKWKVALRPFALPASTMPVIFGTALAVAIGGAVFKPILFLSALLAMVLLHSGANLLNDVYDYQKGIDVHVNPVSGAVVRGWISKREGLVVAWSFKILGIALGLFIFSQVGIPILWIGIPGVLIGVIYTWGPFELKYNALGDFAVFLNFGILGSLGAWTVQTGSPSWVPVIWAIPMAILVSCILHSNNWRDIQGDVDRKIHTIANILGDNRSEKYFAFLLFSPFVFIAALIALTWITGLEPKMPITFLLVFISIPLAVKLLKKGKNRYKSNNPLDFLALDGATAQLNLLFGLLCTAALGLDVLIKVYL